MGNEQRSRDCDHMVTIKAALEPSQPCYRSHSSSRLHWPRNNFL